MISSLGALGLGVPGTGGIGTVVELADQLHRAVEGMEAAIAVIADVHHPPAGRTVAVEDVEFPEGEIGIRRPVVRHGADLRVGGDSLPIVLQVGKEDTRETQRLLAPCLAIEFQQVILERLRLVPLPPWSPDLTPIEEMFSKVKGSLRSAAARTKETVYAAFGSALHDVTLENIAGWFQDRAAYAMQL